MSEKQADYTVRSYSSGTVGRAMNTIRQHHLILDSPSINEEVTSGEAFLSGISACGVTLIEGAARDAGIPLAHTEVTIEGFRAEGRPAFDHIGMRFVLNGVTPEQAEALVGRYKDG